MVKRVRQAAILVQDAIKRSVNISNEGGSNPAPVGEPPHKGSGEFQRSITHDVIETKEEVTGVVGTGIEYGRRLELGFRGTDSMGRKVRQGPRPSIRPGLMNNLSAVKKILGVGK